MNTRLKCASFLALALVALGSGYGLYVTSFSRAENQPVDCASEPAIITTAPSETRDKNASKWFAFADQGNSSNIYYAYYANDNVFRTQSGSCYRIVSVPWPLGIRLALGTVLVTASAGICVCVRAERKKAGLQGAEKKKRLHLLAAELARRNLDELQPRPACGFTYPCQWSVPVQPSGGSDIGVFFYAELGSAEDGGFRELIDKDLQPVGGGYPRGRLIVGSEHPPMFSLELRLPPSASAYLAADGAVEAARSWLVSHRQDPDLKAFMPVDAVICEVQPTMSLFRRIRRRLRSQSSREKKMFKAKREEREAF